jgi:hypothetical protein
MENKQNVRVDNVYKAFATEITVLGSMHPDIVWNEAESNSQQMAIHILVQMLS